MYFIYFNLKEQNFIEGDAAVPGLNRNQAYSNFLLVPSDELLSKFDKVIIPVFEMLDNLQQQNTHLCQIRDRLLPRLISGKLAVKDEIKTAKVVPLPVTENFAMVAEEQMNYEIKKLNPQFE